MDLETLRIWQIMPENLPRQCIFLLIETNLNFVTFVTELMFSIFVKQLTIIILTKRMISILWMTFDTTSCIDIRCEYLVQ